MSTTTDPLPPDWQELKDKSGKVYYYNKKTKETSWKRPAPTLGESATPAANPAPTPAAQGATADADPLPENWAEKKDDKGKVYYYNKKTKETSWKRPVSAATPAAATPPAGAGTPPAVEATLPEDWAEKRDDKGKVYYYNKKTKETSWKRPEISAAATPSTAPSPAAGASESPAPAAAATSTPPPTTATGDAQATTLPEDWVEKKDDKGKVYYYNKKTKETSWKLPPAATAAATSTPPAQPGAGTPPAADATGALPEDWAEKKDDKGKVYYYNKKTKETSWKRPVSAATPAVATPPAGAGTPPGAVEATLLHEDWAEKKDDKGKVYYYNKKTKETTWKRPEVPALQATPNAGATTSPRPATESPVPGANSLTPTPSSLLSPAPLQDPNALHPDWVEKIDAHGALFYYNKKTRETSWKRPLAAAVADKGSLAQLIADREVIPESLLLAQGDWVKKYDSKTSVIYYYNAKLNATRWLDLKSGETTRLLRMPEITVSMYLFGGGIPDAGLTIAPSPAKPPLSSSGSGSALASTAEDRNKGVLCFNGVVWERAPVALTVPLEEIKVVQNYPNAALEKAFVFGENAQTRLPVCLEYLPDFGCFPRPEFAGPWICSGAAIAAVTHGVLFCGGFTDATKLHPKSSCHLLETSKATVHSLPDLKVPRAGHTLSVVNLSTPIRVLWFCFAIGGFDGKKKSSVVERYVLGAPGWETMSPMLTPRSGHGTVVVDRTIYVFGGRSGYDTTNTGEYMHTQTDIWATTAPMKERRCNFGIEVVNQHFVFVVGGWDGRRWLTSCEVYDVRLDMWREMTPLSNGPLSSPGTCVLNLPKQLVGRERSGLGKDQSNAKAGSSADGTPSPKSLNESGGPRMLSSLMRRSTPPPSAAFPSEPSPGSIRTPPPAIGADSLSYDVRIL